MKKLIVAMLMVMMVAGVSACGNDGTPTKESTAQSGVEQSSKEVSNEVSVESKEETKEADELPNWKGVYDNVGGIGDVGSYGIKIAYPSLKPASSGWAYQKDPALVLVTTPGYTVDKEKVVIENVEDAFTLSKNAIDISLKFFRGAEYSDYNFSIQNQETMTMNEWPTCKYTGKHTYTYDGETQEIPFVAYSFYTGQMEGYSYYTVIVMDDSINNPSMDPLPEGVIEAYAKKMVESAVLR